MVDAGNERTPDGGPPFAGAKGGGNGRFLCVSDRLLDADLAPSELRVAVVLARRLRDGASPALTYTDLATDCRLSRDTAFRAVRKLVAMGIASVQPCRRDDGGCSASLIGLAPAWAAPSAKSDAPPSEIQTAPSAKSDGGLAGTEKRGTVTPSAKSDAPPSAKSDGKELERERDLVQEQNSLVGDADPSPATRRRAPKKARTYTPDSREYQLALDLRDRVRENWPTVKLPNDDHLDQWADVVRKMLELDGRTEDDIAALITWATRDSFWSQNIRSTAGLRDHWDALEVKRQSQAKAQAARTKSAPPSPSRFYVPEDTDYSTERSAANA